MEKLMADFTKDKDPAFAAQMQAMMAGMTGVELPKAPEKPPEARHALGRRRPSFTRATLYARTCKL